MLSWHLSDSCLRTSDRKSTFSGNLVLTLSSKTAIATPTARPQRALSHWQNGFQRQLLYGVDLPLVAASQKIDRIEYKKVANELLSCLPLGLQNNVVIHAPFAANHPISFGIKDAGGWDSCRALQMALIAGIETNTIEVRGQSLKVSIELSPRKRATLRNMFRAETFLKKSGGNSESYILCHKSSKILSNTNEELGETPSGSNAWVWNLKNCASCNVSLTGWEEFKD